MAKTKQITGLDSILNNKQEKSILEWEIYFPEIETVIELNHNVAQQITTIILGKASTIQYSINDGTSWNTPSLPISFTAGSYSKWKITAFSGSYTDGTIIIQGTKT